MPQAKRSYLELASVAAAAADLVIVTLVVAWALDEVVYFSLLVGIPVGIASSVVTYLILKKWFGARDD